jgi:hypothetical protein
MLNPATQPSAQPMNTVGIDEWVKTNRLHWAGQTISQWRGSATNLLLEIERRANTGFLGKLLGL